MDFVKAKLVRDYLKEQGAGGMSPTVITELNIIVKDLLDKAYSRSKQNKRSVVMQRDL